MLKENTLTYMHGVLIPCLLKEIVWICYLHTNLVSD